MLKIKKLKNFTANVKHLRKKYKKIDEDLRYFKNAVLENPTIGKDLGHGIYKLRLKNSSKNRGKRAGFRTIYYYKNIDNTIYAISIYDKSEIENIPTKELIELIKNELS